MKVHKVLTIIFGALVLVATLPLLESPNAQAQNFFQNDDFRTSNKKDKWGLTHKDYTSLTGVELLQKVDGARRFSELLFAAQGGDEHAMTLTALAYATGTGVAKNICEAYGWSQRAMSEGYQIFRYTNFDIEDDPLRNANYETAFQFRRTCAEAGSSFYMHQMGFDYMNGAYGTPIKKDEIEGARWFRKAAEAGEPRAMHKLAEALATGKGVTKNEVEALKWYRKYGEELQKHGQDYKITDLADKLKKAMVHQKIQKKRQNGI